VLSRFLGSGILLITVFLCLIIATPLSAQDKTHDKKLEKAKVKKRNRKKDRKAQKYPGKIEPTRGTEVKGNPTKKKRTSGTKYQERIGAGKTPTSTEGTRFGGRNKPKSVGKSKGTKYAGSKVDPEPQIKGNPTKKNSTSGKNYQQRVGNQGPARGTEGTNFRGRGKSKVIRSDGGTNYRGEKVPAVQSIKGNPTKGVGGKKYQQRIGNQGPPRGTDGTNFSGRGRPKKIQGGSDGTTYSGTSTAGRTSTAGGRTTIYGERGRNNKGGGVPEIKQKDQGQRWKGDDRRKYNPEGTPGTNFSGHQKVRKRQILDYGGDWSGDLKVRQRKPNTKPSTYAIKGYRAKEVDQGPGTTFSGYLKKSKKITNWDGADFPGHLKVKPNQKVKTPGTRFAGHLKVKPNAKTKTPGTRFAGHLKVKPNAKVKTEGTEFAGHLKVRPGARLKTEGTTWRGNTKVATRFFKNRHYRKKSREEQLFAGNYKVRRTKGKDLHPSAKYTGRQIYRSSRGQELNRKFQLLLAKTKRNGDQPKHLKKKGKKPKYDPKERDLWHD